MRNHVGFIGLVLCLALTTTASVAQTAGREDARLITATQVLEELRASRDQYIPERLLERAYGIAVVPDVTKVAFIAGGRRGKGILVVRDKNGRFTSPVFVSVTGGSVGWQIGVQSSDIVLVFTTRTGIEGITDGKLTLGADASVAAGPVGRQASAATDASFTAEVYSYSRSRGLFAGVALDGTALTIDRGANQRFYKRDVTASEIVNGEVQSDNEFAGRFLAAIAKSTAVQQASPSPTAPTRATASAPAAPPPAQPAAPASRSSEPGVKTFPMEDPQPGDEPPQ
jgi:lipid-binding SYLF domain-containing protein